MGGNLEAKFFFARVFDQKVSKGSVYASFNLGQCLNVAMLDLVAMVLTAYKL